MFGIKESTLFCIPYNNNKVEVTLKCSKNEVNVQEI